MSSSSCNAIADLRRKLQRVSNKNIIFLDETAMKVNEAPRRTLVARGEKSYAIVSENSSYAARYDMIAACVGDQVLPPIIYTPADRVRMGVSGITSQMLVDFIESIFARAVSGLDRYPMLLVLDKSSIHSLAKVKEAFMLVGCEELTEVILMPTQAAKRLSPLDNGLFHDWKERVRRHSPLTSRNLIQAMNDEWFGTKATQLRHYYHHCGLTQHHPLYHDCPAPASHHHSHMRKKAR